jgi:hypothetical protein
MAATPKPVRKAIKVAEKRERKEAKDPTTYGNDKRTKSEKKKLGKEGSSLAKQMIKKHHIEYATRKGKLQILEHGKHKIVR